MYGKPGDTNLIFHVDFEVNIYVRWTFAHDVLQQSLAASDFIVNVLQMWIKSKPKTLLQDRAKCNLCKYYSSRDSVSAAYLTHLVMEELNALTDFYIKLRGHIWYFGPSPSQRTEESSLGFLLRSLSLVKQQLYFIVSADPIQIQSCVSGESCYGWCVLCFMSYVII